MEKVVLVTEKDGKIVLLSIAGRNTQHTTFLRMPLFVEKERKCSQFIVSSIQPKITFTKYAFLEQTLSINTKNS